MVDTDMLKHMLSGGAAFMLVFSALGQVCYSGTYANNEFPISYWALFPGRYGAYWQLSVGIAVMGVLALVCFLVYLVLSILGLSVLPDLIVNIIGICGAVFWFGMFIAECCAIAWQGTASFTPTRKAFANEKLSKFINENPSNDYEFIMPTVPEGKSPFILVVETYTKGETFDEKTMYDEYIEGKEAQSPCIKTKDDVSMCLGSWSVDKIQKLSDKMIKMSEKEEEKNKDTEGTMKKMFDKAYSQIIKFQHIYSPMELIGSLSLEDSTGMNLSNYIYSMITSIFLSCQVVGIVLFIGSVVLGFIGGSGPTNKGNNNKAEEV